MTENLEKKINTYRILKKTRDDSIAWSLEDFIADPEPKILSFLNAHAVNNAYKNSNFANNLLASDRLLRDGIGVEIALKKLGLGATENLNGTDLIPKIISKDKTKKIAVYGTSDEVLAVLRERLEREGYTNLASMLHGFHDNETYIKDAMQMAPDIIVLCMGMPKQEILSIDLKAFSPLVICGGGWADFYSGVKIRAPAWIQKLKLEWLHRLAKEPKRLGKRYTIDIAYFFWLVLQIAAVKKTNN